MWLIFNSILCSKNSPNYQIKNTNLIIWGKLQFQICVKYCKQVPSETTGASLDVYCQSMIIIFEHVKSIQVKHSGELGWEHREREWDVVNWGERERTELLRENGMGFKLRSTLVDFDWWSKSTQSIFGYSKWPYQHRDILRQCK